MRTVIISVTMLITISIGWTQPTPVTDWPYAYDWTGSSDFVMSGDGRTYIGGDGHWGTYEWLDFGTPFKQFSTYSGKAFSGGRGATTGCDTLFVTIDARSRSFSGSEKIFLSAGRESQSTGAYGETDNIKIYVNNTLIKSNLVRSLSYAGDSLSTIFASIPISVQRTVFTIRIVVDDYSAWSGSRVIVDNISIPSGPLPITLSMFAGAYRPGDNSVGLVWTTLSEYSNLGFEVQRRSGGDPFISIGFVAGHGTTLEPQSYIFEDRNISASSIYHYRLVQLDLDGTSYAFEPISISTSGVMSAKNAKVELLAMRSFPNPFNPIATIHFTVEETGTTTLDIYNTLGQHIVRLFEGTAQSGIEYSVQFNAKNLPSGTYTCVMHSTETRQVRRLSLVK